MSLHLNVINYYRGDTTSVSYFCFITRHLLLKSWIHPSFVSRNKLNFDVTRIAHGFGTNYC